MLEFLTRHKTSMPTPADALPGRDVPIVEPGDHFVLGTPMAPPFPAGTEQLVVGMGCFWGAERAFWTLPGVHTTAVGYGAGLTPNPTYEEVCSGRTGHNEVVLVVFHPEQISLEEILKAFWEGHDPTQGMRQGNDMGTQYRSGIYTSNDAQRQAAEASREAYAEALEQAGPRRGDHHRDRARGRLLLRRGVPPAVPGEEPRRLLRPRRHRRLVPGRADASGLIQARPRRLLRLSSVAAGPGRPPREPRMTVGPAWLGPLRPIRRRGGNASRGMHTRPVPVDAALTERAATVRAAIVQALKLPSQQQHHWRIAGDRDRGGAIGEVTDAARVRPVGGTAVECSLIRPDPLGERHVGAEESADRERARTCQAQRLTPSRMASAAGHQGGRVEAQGAGVRRGVGQPDPPHPRVGGLGVGPVVGAGRRCHRVGDQPDRDQPLSRRAVGVAADHVENRCADEGPDDHVGEQRMQRVPQPRAGEGVLEWARTDSLAHLPRDRLCRPVQDLGVLQRLNGHIWGTLCRRGHR